MKVIDVATDEFQQDLKTIEGDRHRSFTPVEQPLSAEVILKDIREKNRQRVIVLCNTVSHSQGLFKDLEATCEQGEVVITLLHSRFLPDDRKQKESQLETIFGKQWPDQVDGQCQVLISTQVIEVGINITCEVMHTHLCPMSSLLQRAGRCARFGGRGEVRVYKDIATGDTNPTMAQADMGEDVDDQGKVGKKRQYLPYDDDICLSVWDVLNGDHNASEGVGFTTETEWIDAVHQAESELQVKRRRNNRAEFRKNFEAAIFEGDRHTSRELIRWVDNRTIFVTRLGPFIDGEPQQIPIHELEPFSLPRTTLCKALKEFQEAGHQTWLFKRIEYPQDKKAENYSQPICRETNLETTKDVIFSTQILVNPEYVFYNERIGLRIVANPGDEDECDRFLSNKKEKTSVVKQYTYHMDTYGGHLWFMWKCWLESFTEREGEKRTFASVREELLESGGRFIQQKILPDYDLEDTKALFEILVFLAIATHDLGKLQQSWQDSMRQWQQIAHEEFGHSKVTKALLAHTDYDPSDWQTKDAEGRTQKQRMKQHEKDIPRPPHAIESAFLGWKFLRAYLKPLLEHHFDADDDDVQNILSVVIMASGRHHSAWTNGWKLSHLERKDKIVLHDRSNWILKHSWKPLLKSLKKVLSQNIDITAFNEPYVFESQYVLGVTPLALFEPDDLEYQQLYSLVVRALRLCDGRSVQITGGSK